MKELTVKTVFFNSPEELNLEEFINELIEVCSKYKLSFSEICEIFQEIALSDGKNPFI